MMLESNPSFVRFSLLASLLLGPLLRPAR